MVPSTVDPDATERGNKMPRKTVKISSAWKLAKLNSDEAVKAAAALYHPDIEVVHFDVMDYVAKFFQRMLAEPGLIDLMGRPAKAIGRAHTARDVLEIVLRS